MKTSETCSQIARNVDDDKIQQLIETLRLELDSKNQDIEKIGKELSSTNKELCIINDLLTKSLALLSIRRLRNLVITYGK